MSRFAVHRLRGSKDLVLILQSELLDQLPTRVAVPLVPLDGAAPPAARLHPVFQVGGTSYVMATHLMTAIPVAECGQPVGSLEHEHDRIVAALDVLLSGV